MVAFHFDGRNRCPTQNDNIPELPESNLMGVSGFHLGIGKRRKTDASRKGVFQTTTGRKWSRQLRMKQSDNPSVSHTNGVISPETLLPRDISLNPWSHWAQGGRGKCWRIANWTVA